MKKEKDKNNKKKAFTIDLDAHMGLRGMVSAIITLCHGLSATPYHTDLQTSALMPLFFLLSGFSLAIVYGSKPLRLIGTSSQIGAVEDIEALPAIIKGDRVENEQCQPLNIRRFYWNRFARTMPTYYLCTLLQVPLVFMGYDCPWDRFPFQAVISLFPVSSLFNPPQFPLVMPAWFLSTLIWLWALFPCWLTRAQRLTDDQLLYNIRWWFYFQTLTVPCYYAMQPFGILYQMVMALNAKCHPLTRFPLFLMGLYAGLLCLRHPKGRLPWLRTRLGLFPSSNSTTSHQSSQEEGDEESKAAFCAKEVVVGEEDEAVDRFLWSSTVAKQTIELMLLTMAIAAADQVLKRVGHRPSGHGGAVWWSALVPFAQLELIIGLTRDGGLPTVSQALRSPLAQWIGKVNMALYLVHGSIRQYVTFATNGFKILTEPPPKCYGLTWTPLTSAERAACAAAVAYYDQHRHMKIWAFPIFVPTAVMVAALIYYHFEEPIRRHLRKDKLLPPSPLPPPPAAAASNNDLLPLVSKELTTSTTVVAY